MKRQIAVLLHNVRSAHNVGSILRTAEGAGVSKVYLTGCTPAPIDRFGRARRDIEKTALGAQNMVPWEYHTNPRTIIEKLRAQKWAIVGVEQDRRSVQYRSFKLTKPTLFLFGAEVRGLSSALRRRCDALVEIPMRGKKESLNVSVAAGIILFSAKGGSASGGHFNT